jgi:hypothetical protein
MSSSIEIATRAPALPAPWIEGSVIARALTTLGVTVSAGAAAALAVEASGLAVAIAAPFVLAMIGSAVLLHRGHLAVQVVLRALWVAALLPATLFAVLGGGMSLGAAAIPAGLGLALDVRRGSFEPKALRGTFVGLMTLGAIGAAWAGALGAGLLGFALATGVGPELVGYGGALLGVAVLSGLGAFGLYRMRTWGLGLGLVAGLGSLSWALAVGEASVPLLPLLGVALGQVLLTARIVARMLRRVA